MSILKGNFKTKNKIKSKKISKEEKEEINFEKAASKRLGGSITYVSKKKVNWSLKD
tara:strand:- start:1788 stop:1955 length:168 start_codon:yes stop_codon:yes gene_type:complete